MKTLKITTLALLCAAFSLGAYAQNKDVRQVVSFDALHVGGSWDVILEQGRQEEVRLSGRNIDLKKVITEVKNNELHIYLEKGNYRNFDLTVYVTYKNLEEIRKSGSGNLKNRSGISASDFTLHLSGSGNAELESIRAEDMQVHLSGSGNLSLAEGRVKTLAIHQSGSGNIKAIGLQSEDCSISKSGSGNVEVGVSRSLEVASSGSGNVRYSGNPSISKVRFSGSGELVKN